MRHASFAPRHLLDLQVLDDPCISPNGERVAWLRTRIIADEDRYLTALVVAHVDNLDDAEPRVLVERSGLTRPRWSPNGRGLAFLAPDEGNTRQLWLVTGEGGAPRPLTNLQGPVLGFAWSPRGDALAATVRMPVEEGAAPPGVVHTTRLRWKEDGAGLVGDRWRHLVLIPFAGEERGTSEMPIPRTLVGGRCDVAAPAFSPDGTRLAFLGDLGGHETRRTHLYVIDLQRLELPPEHRATFEDVRIAELAWRPDSSALALAGHDDAAKGHYGAQRLWLVDVATGKKRALTHDTDGTLGNAAYTDVGGYGGDTGPRWIQEGEALVAPLSRAGRVRLTRFGLDGSVTPLTPEDRVVAAYSVDATGRFTALLTWGRDCPGTIEIFDVTGSTPATRRTREAEVFVKDAPPLTPEHVPIPATAHAPFLDAWLLLPPRSDVAQGRIPLVLHCGGGPGGMRSDNFFLEFYLLAQAGYAVLWTNARGCQGYGDPFCTAILGSWGGADFDDELRALDTILEAFPMLDGERLAIVGGSYGGYQVVWAIGHSDRFRAAIADRSVSNRVSSFGSSDIGFLRTFEFEGGAPWEAQDAHLKQSPLNSLGGATTPTLVVHSALDYRCPVEQGEQLYTALRVQGVPTELLRFPNESHGLSRGGRPWHRVLRFEAYLEWLERWLSTGNAR